MVGILVGGVRVLKQLYFLSLRIFSKLTPPLSSGSLVQWRHCEWVTNSTWNHWDTSKAWLQIVIAYKCHILCMYIYICDNMIINKRMIKAMIYCAVLLSISTDTVYKISSALPCSPQLHTLPWHLWLWTSSVLSSLCVLESWGPLTVPLCHPLSNWQEYRKHIASFICNMLSFFAKKKHQSSCRFLAKAFLEPNNFFSRCTNFA